MAHPWRWVAVSVAVAMTIASCSGSNATCSITVTSINSAPDGSINCAYTFTHSSGLRLLKKLDSGGKIRTLGESSGGSTFGRSTGSGVTNLKVPAELVKDPKAPGKLIVPACFQIKAGQTYTLDSNTPVLVIYELTQADGTKEKAYFEMQR